MIESLAVSNLLLWIAVIALSVVVLALLRQIGVLHERVAPAGALMVRGGPSVGDAAPVIEVATWSGETLRIGGAEAEGRATLLFFLSPTCPICKTLLPVVRGLAKSEPSLRVVLASDGPRDEHRAFVAERRLADAPYVLSSALGLAYRVAQLPYAVLIDASGVVRAAGLVNTREHLESLLEAQEQGVPSVQAYLRRRESARRESA